jgi:hypothetical protein
MKHLTEDDLRYIEHLNWQERRIGVLEEMLKSLVTLLPEAKQASLRKSIRPLKSDADRCLSNIRNLLDLHTDETVVDKGLSKDEYDALKYFVHKTWRTCPDTPEVNARVQHAGAALRKLRVP